MYRAEEENNTENHHANHAAYQAADGALHGFLGADQRRQLVLAAGHTGEQCRAVRAEGGHQRDQYHTAAVGHHAQTQQAGQRQGNGEPGRENGAHIGE